MLRSLLLALVMVGALLVLLAGASGGLKPLADSVAMLPASVTNVAANWAGSSRAGGQSAVPVPIAPAPAPAPSLTARQQQAVAVPVSQPPPGALERQVSDLQAELAQRSQELVSLRASEEQVRRDVGSLLQQRQTATQAPPTPPAQAEDQPRQEPGTLQQQNAEAALSRLRAQEGQASKAPAAAAQSPGLPVQPSQQPQPQRQASQTSFRPPQAYATQSEPMPSPSANLVTARQLLLAGRTDEARSLLARTQTQMVLQPVAPDQPAALGGNVAATRIGDVIRLLDQGNPGKAMQAINIAMSRPTTEQTGAEQPWQGNPTPAPPAYVYPPASNYNNGYGQR